MEKPEKSDIEDRVVMYIAPSPTYVEEIFAAFHKKYPGVETECVHEPAARFLDRVISELERGESRADIMLLNRQQVEVLKIKGFIEKYASPEGSTFPKRARDACGTQVLIKPFSMAYNTERVSPCELPARYEDLLLPRWKGELLYPDPQTSGSGSGWYAVMKDYLGEDFFRRLAEQDLACRHDPEKWLAEGRRSIIVAAMVDRIEKMKAEGAPVDWLPMPVMWFAGPFAVLFRGAKHPNAGKRLIDLLLSAEGQQIVSRYGFLPNRPGVAVDKNQKAIQEKLKGVKLVSFKASHGRQYFKNHADLLRLFVGKKEDG